MIIAVATQWGENWTRFAYYKIEGGVIREREETAVAPGGTAELIGQLLGLETDLLIAPRSGEEFELALADAGIPLISGITGKADDVLNAYLAGNLEF